MLSLLESKDNLNLEVIITYISISNILFLRQYTDNFMSCEEVQSENLA